MRLAPECRSVSFVLLALICLASIARTNPAGARAAGQWEPQAPLPTAVDLEGADLVSATEGWVVGKGGTVLHTVDAGATWERRSIGSTTSALNDVEFWDADHGWIAGASVWRTTDGGSTWRRGTGLPGYVDGIGFRDITTGFATFYGGLLDGMYRTDDGGQTWHFVPTELDVLDVQFFDASNGVASGPQGIMHTADGGDTWTAVPGNHGGFFIDPDHGWYAFEGVYERTRDGGHTWQDMFMPSSVWVQTGAFFVDATHGWVGGDGQAIAGSSDGGRNWTVQTGGGATYYDRYSFNAIDFADQLHGVAVGEAGTVFTTSDGGATWVNRQSGSGNEVLDMDAVDDQHAWASQAFGEVERTTDGGRTWIRTNPFHQYSTMYGVDFIDQRTGWTVGEDFNAFYQGVIFKSRDGGTTWLQQWTGADNTGLQDVEGLDARTAVAVGTHGIMRTTNGGTLWREVGSSHPLLLAVTFVGDAGWAVGDTLVMRTRDRGAHWSVIVPSLPFDTQFNDVCFAPDGLHGWIVGFYGIVMRTTDGGTTWTQQDVGAGQTTVSSVNVTGPDSAWISGGTGPFGGDPFVKYTSDGGQTWVDRTPPVDPLGVLSAATFLSDTVGWAGGVAIRPGEGIWRYAGV